MDFQGLSKTIKSCNWIRRTHLNILDGDFPDRCLDKEPVTVAKIDSKAYRNCSEDRFKGTPILLL